MFSMLVQPGLDAYPRAKEFIDKAAIQGGRTLVHCNGALLCGLLLF